MITYDKVTELLKSWKICPEKAFETLNEIIGEKDFIAVGLKKKIIQPRHCIQTVKDISFQMVETPYIVIPAMDEIVAFARENYGNMIGEVVPSYRFKTGEKKKIRFYSFSNAQPLIFYNDFIKSKNEILPNVYGLVIAKMLLPQYLPRDVWLVGLDDKKNLSCSHSYTYVPRMMVGSKGTKYDKRVWDGTWSILSCFLSFSD